MTKNVVVETILYDVLDTVDTFGSCREYHYPIATFQVHLTVRDNRHVFRGYYFTEDDADSDLDMVAWFDRRRFDILAAAHSTTGFVSHCPKFDDSHPLVLCRMNFHMRNFLLDAKGRLWLVDWANAGAFPPWLEHAHMAAWADAAPEESRPPRLWDILFEVYDWGLPEIQSGVSGQATLGMGSSFGRLFPP